jgi:hypothetical protein
MAVQKLPTQAELNDALKTFDSIDWTNITKENIGETIPWPLQAGSICPVNFPKDHYIYRARSYHSFPSNISRSEDNIFLPSSFSYAPESKSRINRANFPRHPMFYGASNLMAAIVEAELDGHLDFVGCWKIKSGHTLKIRPFISNIPAQMQESSNLSVWKIKKLYDEVMKILRQLDEFNDRQFTKQISNPTDYMYTAWLAHMNMYRYRNRKECKDIVPDAIMFQCTKDDRLGTNLAIDKDFVDEALELEQLYLLSHQYNQKEKTFTRLVLSCGCVENETIIWKKPDITEYEKFIQCHHVPIYARLL